MSTISKTKFEKLKLNRFGTSLKINLEQVKTGLELVKTGLFQQKKLFKNMVFPGFEALHPLTWPKNFLVPKKILI